MKSGVKFGLGIAIGMAVGAAIAYLADKDKREDLLDSVSTAADKARDSVVEGYYEAKEKYYKYRDRLKKEGARIMDSIDTRMDIDAESENID